MPDREKPTAQDILEELEQAKAIWNPVHSLKRELQTMYRREYPVQYLKSGSVLIDPVPYRSGTYDKNIDALVGVIDVKVEYKVNARGLGPTPQTEAEKIQQWDNEIIGEIEFYQGQRFGSALCADVLNYGCGAVSVLPDFNVWQDYPAYDPIKGADSYNKLRKTWGELAPPPIRIDYIPALTWFPLLSGDIVVKSFQVQTVRVADIRFRFPWLSIPDGTKDTDEVEYITYMDDTCVIYMVSKGSGLTAGSGQAAWSELAKTFHHCMPLKGQAPVVLYKGLTTADPELKYRFKGYAEGLTDTIKTQDMMISAQATRAAAFGGITPILQMLEQNPAAFSPEMFKKLQQEIKFVINGVNVAIPGTRWEFLQPAQASLLDEYLWKKLESNINDYFPPAIRGDVPAGTAGYTLNQASEWALTRVKPVVQNMVKSDVGVMRMIHLVPAALRELTGEDIPIYVRHKTDEGIKAIYITADDVEDIGVLLEAERVPKLTIDILSNLQAANEARQMGLPSTYAFQELAHISNPQKLMDQGAAEALMKTDPVLIEARRKAILKEMGVLRAVEEGITPEQAATYGPLSPFQQRLLAAMGQAQALAGGNGNMPIETGVVGSAPTQVMGMPPAPGAPVITPPQMTPPGPPLPPPPRRNPRAGQRTQPGGPRRRTSSVQRGAQA